jgi:hypothetical protein
MIPFREVRVAAAKPNSERKGNKQNGGLAIAVPLFNFFGTIVEKFGWPGALVLFLMYFVEKHGTDAQKREIIDMYILGHGIASHWPLVVVGVVSIAALFAQKWYCDVKVATISKRLDEIAHEKSSLQEQLVGKKLQHADNS